MNFDQADFAAREDVAKRLPPQHAEEFRAHHMSVPEWAVKDDLPGHALRAAFDALVEARRTNDEQAARFRELGAQQLRWRELAKARGEDFARARKDVVELARLREVATVVRRAHIAGRKTLRVADLIALMDREAS